MLRDNPGPHARAARIPVRYRQDRLRGGCGPPRTGGCWFCSVPSRVMTAPDMTVPDMSMKTPTPHPAQAKSDCVRFSLLSGQLLTVNSRNVSHETRRRGLFSLTHPTYIGGCRGDPAMAINGRRNKPFGPGGSTRRLHQSPAGELRKNRAYPTRTGLRRGRNRIDEGVKGGLLLGMVPPLSGQFHSCQRQLCSGCSGCVSGLTNQAYKS
jgi:hypothetical protein